MKHLGSPSVLCAALTLAAAALAAPPAHAARPPTLPRSARLTIVGHGWGHGHGMSQYGARGAALAGLSYRGILRFYYPHTAMRRTGGTIRVYLAEGGSTLTVHAQRGLVVRGRRATFRVAARHPHASRFRIVPLTGGRDRLQYLHHGWHTMFTRRADLAFRSTRHRPLRLYVAGGSRRYSGALRSVSPDGGRDRWTVDVVPLQTYVRGVVTSEMPSDWPRAALRAQAVAVRTYAAYERWNGGRGNHFYDICDTSACQVYGGYDAVRRSGAAAARATAGQIRTYRGHPAFAQFASSDGGETLAGSAPYLVSRRDRYERRSHNPYETWRVHLTIGRLMARWPRAGRIRSVRLAKVAGTDGRWVSRVVILGRRKRVSVAASTFQAWLGLRSTNFRLR